MMNGGPLSLMRKLSGLSMWLGGRTLTYTARCSSVSSVHKSKRAGEGETKRKGKEVGEIKIQGKCKI